MKQKANLIAAGTFLLGLVGFQFYARQLRAEVQGGKPISVLIVTGDLSVGEKLSVDNLASVSIPKNYVDSRRVLSMEKTKLIGVPVGQALQAGDALIWSDLADGAAHKHLASLITPGRRAYTLDSGANPLGRLLRVADHVDVILEAAGKSETILQRVLVLAVGGRIERDDALLGDKSLVGSGVTLSVTPQQARKLLTAESDGELRLVLRNPEDHRKETFDRPAQQKSNRTAAPKTKEIEHVR